MRYFRIHPLLLPHLLPTYSRGKPVVVSTMVSDANRRANWYATNVPEYLYWFRLHLLIQTSNLDGTINHDGPPNCELLNQVVSLSSRTSRIVLQFKDATRQKVTWQPTCVSRHVSRRRSKLVFKPRRLSRESNFRLVEISRPCNLPSNLLPRMTQSANRGPKYW
jgi:hypothetical protein